MHAWSHGLQEEWMASSVGKQGVQATSPPSFGGGAAAGSYGYLGTQVQPTFGGAFPAAKPPPTFPPPQAKEVPSSLGTGRLAQPDLPRVLHTQPPPPPSRAPQVPPAQLPIPQGPPPAVPPLMSPSSQSAATTSISRRSGEDDISEAEKVAKERYGLLGILKVIRMTDADLNTLALGMDLTTLGLNLNSPECLYSTFASPWSDAPAQKDPNFFLPPCYYMNPPQLKQAHLQKFSLETLFYIFFNMPRDTLQAYAAAELYNRGWQYHRELKTWFILQEEEGQPRWVFFDLTTWEKHYYGHPVDTQNFLAEDDVRVKMPPPGQMPSPISASS